MITVKILPDLHVVVIYVPVFVTPAFSCDVVVVVYIYVVVSVTTPVVVD